jgi:serine-type D-Ala-D-Ala carboxypeptidase/endopeptidase (penicillin-binding protein 4)
MWSFVNTILLSATLQVVLDSSLSQLPSIWSAIATAPVIAAPQIAQSPDPIAEAATNSHLSQIKQAGYGEASQGVWLQTNDGNLLASRQATRALPVASLTKAATTLAAISTWEPDYRFVTQIGTNGRLKGDLLTGDLIIVGSGDPFLVWEEGIAIGNTLNQMGIRQVQGGLIVRNNFLMNFESKPILSANLLRQAMNASNWSPEISAQYAAMPRGTLRPNLKIYGPTAISSSPSISTRLLINHFSLPLWQILKRMNTFSNNAMSEMLANSLGGVTAVTNKVIAATGIPANEIRLTNGSGLGQQNQISPRGVVAILMAIQNRAQAQKMSLADYFPVSDCNCGTIEGRNLPSGAIVKTGTLSDVSSLAGVIQTRDKGAIWFAIINRGAGELSWFHGLQNRLLLDLSQKWNGNTTNLLTKGLSPNFAPTAWQDRDRNQIVGIPPNF